MFDSETGRQLRRIALKGNLVRLAFSPDGKRIVATDRDVAVRMYSTETGKPVWSREIPPAKNAESYTSAVAYSPDGKTIAAGAPVGPDESIYLLDAATGDVAGKLVGHGWKRPWALAFTSDSKIALLRGLGRPWSGGGTCPPASLASPHAGRRDGDGRLRGVARRPHAGR